MSTVTAPGPGRWLPVISQCYRRHIHVAIKPLEGGRRDVNGYSLHLRYEIGTGGADTELIERRVASSSGANSQVMAVEFDAGSHSLNYGGSLYLTGGTGPFNVEVHEGRIGYGAHWHYLSVVVPGLTYQTPAHHGIIGAGSSTPAQLGLWTAVLDHRAVPMSGLITLPTPAASLFTGWWG